MSIDGQTFFASSVLWEKAGLVAVARWPKEIWLGGNQVINPSADMCVKAGYRLLPDKPSTPEGKIAVKTELVQDDKDPTKLTYVIEYADAPPPPPPPKIEIVGADKVEFVFEDGEFSEIRLKDTPKDGGDLDGQIGDI